MSHAAETHEEHHPHVLPVKVYVGVWIALLILTVVTVRVSYFDFGAMNIVVAMGVAGLKASLVALYFMHLKYDERFNVLIFVGSLIFLAVFFILTLADTEERGRIESLKANPIQPVPARPELLETLSGEGHGDEGAHGKTGAHDGEHQDEGGHAEEEGH